MRRLPGLVSPFPQSAALLALVRTLTAAGARVLAVGGAVRDHLCGEEPKDIDVEVYGLSLEALERCLAPFDVHAVGRSFGVLKVDVTGPDGRETFDVALPRTESKSARGHRGFVVESDPFLDVATAFARRDFTINAIGVDLVTGEVVDPHGGVIDLQNGLLRHVSDAFDEDPLRVLRAAQFASRLLLNVDESTLDRCRRLKDELPTLAKERLWGELEKLLVRGVWPSIGLEVLRKTDALSVLFPELFALIDCPQEPEWHPEGDVWRHTLMVVDEAALLARNDGLDAHETLLLTLGALCHDLGKPATTVVEDGRIRSRDHESQGEAPTRTFLERVQAPHAIVEDVVALVREHLKPFMLYRDRERVSDGALRRLALRVPIARLVRVARADHLGRTTPEALCDDDPASPWILGEAARLHVESQKPEPIVLGRHLVARGHKPGVAFKSMLADAFAAQLDGAFFDEPGANEWLDAYLAKAGER